MVDGDQIMARLALDWQKQNLLTGPGVVATVMSNLGLERCLTDHDLHLARTDVGDRYVVEHMRANGYNLGGEQSGHMILSDFSTTGDGLIAALQVLAVLKRSGRKMSEMAEMFEPVPQILKDVRYKDGEPLNSARVHEAIEAARADLGNSGRILVRKSGTEKLIRVMGEGDDETIVHRAVDQIVETVKEVAA